MILTFAPVVLHSDSLGARLTDEMLRPRKAGTLERALMETYGRALTRDRHAPCRNNMAIVVGSSAFTGAVPNCKIVGAHHAGSTFTSRCLGEFLRDRRFGRRGADRVAVRSDCVDYRVDQTKHWSRG